MHIHTMYSGDPLKDSATSLMVRCWAIPKSKTAEEEVSQDGNNHVVWLNVSNPNDSYLQPSEGIFQMESHEAINSEV